MAQNPSYAEERARFYSERFRSESISELVDTFNREVGRLGWTAERSYHDRALIDELVRRGVDVSAVHKGTTTDFSHRVRFTEEARALVRVE